MRCFVCSDIHMNIDRLRQLLEQAGDPVEAVLFAGDLTNLGERAHAMKVLDCFPDVPIYAIPGNMDGEAVMDVFEERTHRVHAATAPLGEWTVLGFGGGGLHNHGASLFSEDAILAGLAPFINTLDGARTILLTHQPPHATTLDRMHATHAAGSKAVRQVIRQLQPAFHVCGHIHESWNEDTIGASRCFNVAAVTEGRAATLDLTTGMFTRLCL